MARRTLPELFQHAGPSVDLYDALHQSGAGACAGDIEFYRRHARRTGGPVLELGSGTGRVTLPLARAGFDVVGLDRSSAMLAAARAKLSNEPDALRIAFVRGNMARFDLTRRFRLVLVPNRAFQHLLTPRDQRSCLASIRHHLYPRGLVIIHSFDPRLELCLPENHGPLVKKFGFAPSHHAAGRHLVSRGTTRGKARDRRRVEILVRDRRNDPLTQTFSETWRWIERGANGAIVRDTEETLRLRWTYRQEMAHLFELTGFTLVAEYSDFLGSPPQYGAQQIWVAGRR